MNISCAAFVAMIWSCSYSLAVGVSGVASLPDQHAAFVRSGNEARVVLLACYSSTVDMC